MPHVEHFAYGPINPILAFVLSFLGSLLSLVLARRSREVTGGTRARYLLLAAVALGGTGIWLMHFMAMLGFDVREAPVQYDLWLTVVSFVIAVAIVAAGLFLVGFSRPSAVRIVAGGIVTGLGVAAMHYTGMYAMRFAGEMTFDLPVVGASVGIAVVASAVALWFATVIRGAAATVGAAVLMGVAVTTMHYTGMYAVRVTLVDTDAAVTGLGAFELLTPIAVLAAIMILALGYATVGSAARPDLGPEPTAVTHPTR